MIWLRWVGFAIGLGVLAGTAGSVLNTVLGPYGRASRLAAGIGRGIEALAGEIADRTTGERRMRVMALAGPVALLAVLIAWLLCTLIGYALLSLPFTPAVGEALRLAGSSVFTLGFDAPHGTATIIAVASALSGLLIITVELAYLPSLYAAYNRRERAVALLANRVGDGPLTGDRLLDAHARDRNLSELGELYSAWESWCADVLETHSNYPILAGFRSPAAPVGWLYALLAVLDAAALHRAACPRAAPPQAQRLIRIGARLLTALSATAGPRPRADPISAGREADVRHALEHLDLPLLLDRLTASGVSVEQDAGRAGEAFNSQRRSYALLADGLARRLRFDPPTRSTGPHRWTDGRHRNVASTTSLFE